MANYASNLLFASTENEKDLEKMAELLRENFFDCNVDWYDEYIDVDFSSKWCYPEGVIDEIISSLEEISKITTVQRNYPIGSVDLNRNHSSDVLV